MNGVLKAVHSWKALSAPRHCCGWNLHLRAVKNNYLRHKVILHFVVQSCRQESPKNCLDFRTQVAEMQLLQSTERDVGHRYVLHGAGDTSELAKQVNFHGHSFWHQVLPQKLQKILKRHTKWFCRKMFVSIPSPHLTPQKIEVPQIVKTNQTQFFLPSTNYNIWWDAALLDTHKRDTVLMHTYVWRAACLWCSKFQENAKLDRAAKVMMVWQDWHGESAQDSPKTDNCSVYGF